MRKKIFALFIILFVSSIGFNTFVFANENDAVSQNYSNSDELIQRLSLSLDNRCDLINKYQNKEGNKNFCQINPIFGLHYNQHLNQTLKFNAKVDLAWPYTPEDNSYTKLKASLLAGINYYPHSIPLYYNAMLGFALTHIRGKGGVQTLNNGNGTEEFYNPSLNQTATNFMINLGLGYDLKSLPISPQIYTQIYNLTNNDKRSFNLGLGVVYHLGQK